MTAAPYPGPVPAPPRQGQIWWSSAPPTEPPASDQSNADVDGFSEQQVQDWLSCTTGWKALELTWGAVQSCGITRARQLKPLLQAALAEAARLEANRLVVRQLDIDELLGRCTALALSAFPNFTVLKLRELNMYDEAMGHLCSALHECDSLRRLVLDTVWASESGWSTLGAALRVNTSITALRMRRCLSGSALHALCSALADQRGSLQDLRLSYNDLGESGVTELCKALTKSCSAQAGAALRPSPVSTLDLSYNAIVGSGCVPMVASAIRAVKALKSLDLSYNDLGPEGTRELCRAVSSAPHLTALKLAGTGADDGAAEALAKVLQAAAASTPGRGLSAVCLADNRLGPRGATLLAAAARRPGCGLTDMDLGGNGQVGETGARAWAAVLSAPAPSCRLARLVLSGCEVPDSGAYVLGAALKGNNTLTELGLADNYITTSGLALLAEVLKTNTTLQVLDVSHNMVGPQGLKPLSAALSQQQQQQTKGGPQSETSKRNRESFCLIKAELLPEYRNVEAVKRISTLGGGVDPQSPKGGSRGGGAGTGGRRMTSPGGSPYYGGNRNPFRNTVGGDRNPFLSSPSSAGSNANPFRILPRTTVAGASPSGTPTRRRGWTSYGGNENGAKNPFIDDSVVDYSPPDGYDAGFVNPFYGKEDEVVTEKTNATAAAGARCGGDGNPFLSPANAASEAGSIAGAGGGDGAGDAQGDAADDRQLATRVLTKLGGGGGTRSGAEGGDGDTGASSVSGTCVYVSSRASTADEGDLVTDRDMVMVDFLLESLGVGSVGPMPAFPSFSQAGGRLSAAVLEAIAAAEAAAGAAAGAGAKGAAGAGVLAAATGGGGSLTATSAAAGATVQAPAGSVVAAAAGAPVAAAAGAAAAGAEVEAAARARVAAAAGATVQESDQGAAAASRRSTVFGLAAGVATSSKSESAGRGGGVPASPASPGAAAPTSPSASSSASSPDTSSGNPFKSASSSPSAAAKPSVKEGSGSGRKAPPGMGPGPPSPSGRTSKISTSGGGGGGTGGSARGDTSSRNTGNGRRSEAGEGRRSEAGGKSASGGKSIPGSSDRSYTAGSPLITRSQPSSSTTQPVSGGQGGRSVSSRVAALEKHNPFRS